MESVIILQSNEEELKTPAQTGVHEEKMSPDSCVLRCFSLLFLVTDVLGSPEYYIDWTEASRQCKTKYDSELIAYDYLNKENLSAEIITDLGVNISAWIDGKVHHHGCTVDACYRVHQIHTTEDRNHPSICVKPDTFNVNLNEVTYMQALNRCGTETYRMSDVDLTIEKIPTVKKPTIFWLPNIELTVDDGECTFVITRDNKTLETKYDNCTIPKMAVCINISYIPDHQMSTYLEIAPKFSLKEISLGNLQMKEEEDIYKAESLQIRESIDTGLAGTGWNLKSLLPFALSGFNLILFLVLMFAMIALWKKVVLKLNHIAGTVNSTKSRKKSKLKRKKIFKQTEYQGLSCTSPSNSTRVKMLPEEENPYSEIAGKESCFGGADDNVFGATCNGYTDMKAIMPREKHLSSFKIGKKVSSSPDPLMYD